MEINKMISLTYDELRALYRNFLHSQNISKATINTAYADTFYLWRKGSKDLFWNVVNATDFETEAKKALIKALTENSTGNVNTLFSRYLSHLRRSAIITAETSETGIEYKVELGDLTDVRKQKICRAIEDGRNYGYVLSANRYFFVEKFYETDFKKLTARAPMGTRVFDLSQILETEQLPETAEIAELLKTKTWG